MKKIIKKLLRESILKSPFKGRNILYHSTFIDKLLNILTDNEIKPKTTQKILTKFNGDSKYYNGVSLTRNVNLVFNDVQLILDGDAIKRDFGKRLVPHDYFAQFGSKTKSDTSRSDYNESEEFFIGTLESISKYLLGIRFALSKETIEDFKMSEPDFFSTFKEKVGDIPLYNKDFERINL